MITILKAMSMPLQTRLRPVNGMVMYFNASEGKEKFGLGSVFVFIETAFGVMIRTPVLVNSRSSMQTNS
jgi:hypothetical protein